MSTKTNTPIYTILAGSNGAGKSTFRALFNFTDKTIDPDEIGRVNNISEMEAGRMAVKEIKNCFKNKESFTQETTLASGLNSNIELAKMQGYQIDLVYIAIDSPERAISNIQERVKQGLHNIPDETVKKRFEKTYNNLIKVSEKVDNVIILDNSNYNYQEILHIEDRKLLTKNEKMPNWISDITEKVSINATKSRPKEILKVNKKDFALLEKFKIKNPEIKFKVNPFELESNRTATILAPNEVIKTLEHVLDKFKDIER